MDVIFIQSVAVPLTNSNTEYAIVIKCCYCFIL